MRTIVNKLLINIQFLKFSLLLLKVKNKIIEKKNNLQRLMKKVSSSETFDYYFLLN